MSRHASLIPLSIPVLFPKKSHSSKSVSNSSKRSARSEPLVFAIFLTTNQAFIKSVYRNPPTYDSGRKPCHVVDTHVEQHDILLYEQSCTKVLESGTFRRVQLYIDPSPDAAQAAVQQRLLALCKRLHLHVDVTTAPRPENLTSPRACLLKVCQPSPNEGQDSRMSREQLLSKLSAVSEKMATVLRGKLLITGEPPQDADTVFAFHDCWKQLYCILQAEQECHQQTEQEQLEKRQLYCLELQDFYDDVPL